MKPNFDGDTLILQRWSYARPDARVPHRHSVLAQCQSGQDTVYVCRNHSSFRGLFWIHASGEGFAGLHSRATNTITTRNEALALKWVAAVNAGNVRIE